MKFQCFRGTSVQRKQSRRAEYDSEQESTYYREGFQAYREGNFKQAENNLRVVVAMQSDSYLNREALYYLARSCYLQKDYDAAEQYYLQYLEQFPGTNYHDDSLFYLGVVYHITGQSEKAVAALKEMQKVSPNCGYESSDMFKRIMNDS